jgi:hypothetical protein
MHDLRSLKTQALLFPAYMAGAVLFHSPLAHALVQTVNLSSQYESISGTPDPSSILSGPSSALSQTRETLGYKLEDVFQNFTVSGTVVNAAPDYSQYLVISKTGNPEPLSNLVQTGNEFSASFATTYAKSSTLATLGWNGSLNQSPFAAQTFNAAAIEGFYNKSTLLGVSLIYGFQDQPESYYIDSDFHSQARPVLLHSLILGTNWDQILTERWKLSLSLSTGTRYEDRPRNIGLSLKQAYALSDRIFCQFTLSDIQELHSEPLKDERGYFSIHTAQLDVTFEPWIDFLITPSYAYVIEGENNPDPGSLFQIGSDQVGLSLGYRKNRLGLNLKTAYRRTNTSLSDLFLDGGVTWQI